MAKVQDLPRMDWESCTLARYDNNYQNAKESLEDLQNIVFIAIAEKDCAITASECNTQRSPV